MDEITFFMTYQSLKKELTIFYENPKMLENLLTKREFTPKQVIHLQRLFNDEKFSYIFSYLKAHNSVRGMILE